MSLRQPASNPAAEPPIDATLQISTTVRIIRKRPCAASNRSAPPPRKPKPLQAALQDLQKSIQAVQHKLQNPALQQVCHALNNCPPSGQFPAVCIHTGTSAAAGDSSSFDCVLDHIESEFGRSVEIRSLHPSRHDSLRSIADALSNIQPSVRVVVAVEHAHLFHSDLLSDLVYLLQHLSSQACKISASPPPVAALFAIPHTTALFDCLNVRDAACLSTTLVRMPTQPQAFESLISGLSERRGVLFTAEVFNLIESHFFNHDMSLAMLMRTFRHIITLHYAATPLSDWIVDVDRLQSDDPMVVKKSLTKLKSSVSTNLFYHFAEQLPSVKPHVQQARQNSEDPTSVFITCFVNLAKWKRIVTSLESLSIHLDSVWNANHADLLFGSRGDLLPSGVDDASRVSIFKHFLPTDTRTAPGERFKTLLINNVKKLNRADLRAFVMILVHELRTFPALPELDLATLVSRLDDLLAKLDKRPNTSSQANMTPQSTPRGGRASGLTEVSQRRASGGTAALAMRRKMLSTSAKKAQEADPLHATYMEIIAILNEVYSFAGPLQDLPLHEMLLYTNVDELSNAGGGLSGGAQPRMALFHAFRNPAGVVPSISNHPDSAVAFRILVEGGRLVSLYDWYNIFASTLTAAKLAGGGDDDMEVDSLSTAEIQARFARACSELELIGLLKYTNRKTDHVARLAFE